LYDDAIGLAHDSRQMARPRDDAILPAVSRSVAPTRGNFGPTRMPMAKEQGMFGRDARRWLLGAWLGLCSLPAAHAQAPTLEARIGQALQQTGMTGAVWATVDASGAIDVGAAGVSNARTGAAMTPDSQVHVGSIAKTLIATGVLQLASHGRVDLDAPVSRYLPSLPLDNPWPGDPVRVRHLLDHTAGLDDMRLWQLFTTRATPDTPLRAAFSRDPTVLAVRSRPGSRFSYSNMGYTLAAMVIEAVTHERYERWLDRELLRPLGMRDSTFGFTTQVGPEATPRLAWGHLDRTTPAPALPVYLRPAGQFTTTARDLALLAKFLLGDGRVGDRVIVETRWLRAMGQATTTEAARGGLRAGYGLGLSRRDRHGVVGLCHDGSVVGFHSMLCLFPQAGAAAGKAFVVVQNTDGDGIDTGRFDALLIEALAVPQLPVAPAALPPRGIGDWQGRYVPAPNRFAAFAYFDFLFDSPRLRWDGAALHFATLQGPARLLTPAGGTHFIANERRTPSHVLLEPADGERLISTGLRTYRKVHAAAYWLVASSLALGLLGLLWFALGVPARAVLGREPLLAPGVVAAALLLVPVPWFYLQSYTQLGDVTAASVALYAGTAALPVLMLAQAWRSARRREGLARGRANLAAALLVLQWCAVLIGWGVLPFALWR
jgi:CubicO group peptidase (beta-lactamase class C family)